MIRRHFAVSVVFINLWLGLVAIEAHFGVATWHKFAFFISLPLLVASVGWAFSPLIIENGTVLRWAVFLVFTMVVSVAMVFCGVIIGVNLKHLLGGAL